MCRLAFISTSFPSFLLPRRRGRPVQRSELRAGPCDGPPPEIKVESAVSGQSSGGGAASPDRVLISAAMIKTQTHAASPPARRLGPSSAVTAGLTRL